MATERIQIIVSERGSREVRRNLEDIGSGALKAEGALSLLKSTLGTLSVGFIVSELVRLADTYANVQNRLRLVTTDTANLNAVTSELLAISNRTRTSFEGTAQLYARVALSAKTLGRSQQELLQFTESLNQAVILSGASAREAEGAIIQLAQGMASGRLQGDELRSVLEQLPLVADVIARYIGVTRGELRELAADGKVSAQTVLDAFAAARTELAENFAKTIPTIGQSLEVLKNRFIEMWGTFSQTSGLAMALSSAIIFLSNNLDTLTQIVVALSAVFVARWIAGGLIAGVTAVRTFITAQMALNVALGATSTVAAAAGVGMKVFQIALSSVLSTTVLLTVAIAGLTFGLAFLASSAMEANQILSGLQESGRTAANDLFELEAKARAAGMNVDTLSNAAATGNPLIQQIAASYGGAADQASRLAENARQAAIAVAQGKIAELRAQRDTLMRPIDDNLGRRGPVRQFFSGVDYYGQRLFGGPDLQERISGARNLENQIDIYNRQIALLREVPDQVFAPPQYTAPPSTPKKGRGGGGGRTDAEILAEFNAQLRDDIELAGLSGAAHEKRSAILQLQRQLGRELTTTERQHTEAMLDELQAAKDLAMFRDWSDAIRDEVQLLGLSNRERERQEEILRLENQLRRELTQTERELVDARLDELQVARDSKQMRDWATDIFEENELLRYNTQERRVRTKIMELERDLQRELTPAEEAWADAIARQNIALEDQSRLLDDTVGKREAWYELLNNAYALKMDPNSGFTQGDFFNQVIGSGEMGQFFEGTDLQQNAQLEGYQTMYEQIQVMRSLDLENAASYNQALAALDARMFEVRTQGMMKFLSTTAGLQRSNIKEVAAIGKAAAVAQAMIAGKTAVLEALKGPPGPPWSYGIAAATAAMVASNIAQIISTPTGFMTGGSFVVPGTGGPDSKMMAIRATPGERISVQTPAQYRKGTESGGEGGGGSQPVQVRVINVDDPRNVYAALDTAEGAQVVMNIIERDANTYRRLFGVT